MTKDKISPYTFDKDGRIKPIEKEKPPVIIKGMKTEEDGETGWEDERGNWHINPKE